MDKRIFLFLCVSVSALNQRTSRKDPCMEIQPKASTDVIELDCSSATSELDLGNEDFSGFYEVIRMEGTSVQKLPMEAFGKARAKNYNIETNAIKQVEYGALGKDKLERVVNIIFSENQITDFPWDYMESFTNLEQLILFRNQIASIPSTARLPSSLTTLILSENPLKTIDPFVFTGIKSLIKIDLSSTELFTIQENTFAISSPLHPELILKFALIQEVAKDAFGAERQREMFGSIQLNDNMLTSLRKDAFEDILLHMLVNKNRTLDTFVSLENNPFVCDCSILWVYNYGLYYGSVFKNLIRGFVCDENKVSLWDLPPTHFSACSKN